MIIKVLDMNCKNCQAKIEKYFLINNIKANFDLKNKTIEVNESNLEQALSFIKKAGYHPEV